MDYNKSINMARNEGYSDKEILDYLSKNDNKISLSVKKALKEGYLEKEILDYLSNNIYSKKPEELSNVNSSTVEIPPAPELSGLESLETPEIPQEPKYTSTNTDNYVYGQDPSINYNQSKQPVKNEQPQQPVQQPEQSDYIYGQDPSINYNEPNSSTSSNKQEVTDKNETSNLDFTNPVGDTIANLADRDYSAYVNINRKWNTTLNSIGSIWDSKLSAQAEEDAKKLKSGAVGMLKSKGFNASIDQLGRVIIVDDNNNIHEVTEGFLNTLEHGWGEILGSIGGALTGAASGVEFGPVGVAVGALAGGALGAGAGAGLDYARNSLELAENLETKSFFNKMADAGIADPILSILGYGGGIMAKSAGKTIHRYAITPGVNTVKNAYKLFRKGNPDAALKFLKEQLNITDEEAQAITDSFLQVSDDSVQTYTNDFGKVIPLTSDEKQILALLNTQEKGYEFLRRVDARGIISGVNKRAEEIIKASKDLAEIENPKDKTQAAELVDYLNKYSKDVQKLFDKTKKDLASGIDRTDFTFNVVKLSKEGLDTAKKTLTDPIEVEKLKNVIIKTDKMNKNPKFSDLFELRQLMNELKNSTNSKVTQDAIKKNISSIDKTINSTLKEYYTPRKAKSLSSQYKEVNRLYSRMKILQSNNLRKLINKDSSPENIAKAFIKYGESSKDDTLKNVMNVLPARLKSKAEGSVLNQLRKNYTVGNVEGDQAIDFVNFYNEVKDKNFSSPGAREFVNLLEKYANIFKGDKNLFTRIGSGISKQMPKNSSYLTTNLFQRAKYELATTAFSQIKSYLPTESSRNLALYKTLKRILKNPLDTNIAKDYVNLLPKEEQDQISKILSKFRNSWVEAGKIDLENDEPFYVYLQSKSSKPTVRNGNYGSGYHFWKKLMRIPKYGVLKTKVKPSELADIDDIKRIVGNKKSYSKILNNKSAVYKLKKEGFKGINIMEKDDNKVILFDKPELE